MDRKNFRMKEKSLPWVLIAQSPEVAVGIAALALKSLGLLDLMTVTH